MSDEPNDHSERRRSKASDDADELREIAKGLLIELGSRYAKQTMGSSMLGGIQDSTTVRPFRIGDDFDMIHLEETMDYLLSQGHSSFDVINYDDFLIYRKCLQALNDLWQRPDLVKDRNDHGKFAT